MLGLELRQPGSNAGDFCHHNVLPEEWLFAFHYTNKLSHAMDS